MAEPTSPMDQRRLYRDLAWLWPIISPPEDYVEESEAFSRLLQESAAGEVQSLLHLGCGGGHNDLTFKRRFQVFGVDASEPMLEIARRLNPDVAYCQGDIRSVRLGKTFDAVAALDALSYMLTEEELRAAFATAHAHLRPGGVFLTYAEETKERFQQNRTVGSSGAGGGVDVTFVESFYDPDPADTTYEATFIYLIRRRGALTIETDRHVLGIFHLDTWVRLLLEAGFSVKQFAFTPAGREPIPVLIGIKPALPHP